MKFGTFSDCVINTHNVVILNLKKESSTILAEDMSGKKIIQNTGLFPISIEQFLD